jgi:hypothetical protein
MRRATRIVVTSFLLASCASATSSVADEGSAATALRAAAERTLGVQSFHVASSFQTASGPRPGTVDYQAPDREHERSGTGSDATETISIGDTLYLTADKPGYFWKIEGRGIGASDTLGYLRLLRHAENVRLDGYLYRFDLPAIPDGPVEGSTTGVATLTDDGFINTLLYHRQFAGDEVTVGFTYSAYNSGITVEPPPPDLIVKQTPMIACPSPMPPASQALPNGAYICQVIEPSP